MRNGIKKVSKKTVKIDKIVILETDPRLFLHNFSVVSRPIRLARLAQKTVPFAILLPQNFGSYCFNTNVTGHKFWETRSKLTLDFGCLVVLVLVVFRLQKYQGLCKNMTH